ncbi:MAG: hypothetical protein ACYS9T_06305 [Planctomycetota bacterium]
MSASEPDDLESLFNLTVRRCVLKDYAGATESMKKAVEAGLPFAQFLAGPSQILEPLRDPGQFRRYAAWYKVQLTHGPMLGCLTDTSAKSAAWSLRKALFPGLLKTSAPSAVMAR